MIAKNKMKTRKITMTIMIIKIAIIIKINSEVKSISMNYTSEKKQ